LVLIANISSDSYPGGDNEVLYNGVPESRLTPPLVSGGPAPTPGAGSTPVATPTRIAP